MYIHLLDTAGLLLVSIVQHRAMSFPLPQATTAQAAEAVPTRFGVLRSIAQLIQVLLFHTTGYIVVFAAFCVCSVERSLIGGVYFLTALVLLFR